MKGNEAWRMEGGAWGWTAQQRITHYELKAAGYNLIYQGVL
jgi:hypothetical protein